MEPTAANQDHVPMRLRRIQQLTTLKQPTSTERVSYRKTPYPLITDKSKNLRISSIECPMPDSAKLTLNISIPKSIVSSAASLTGRGDDSNEVKPDNTQLEDKKKEDHQPSDASTADNRSVL